MIHASSPLPLARARRLMALAGALLLAGCATTRAATITMGTGAKPDAAAALDAERGSLRLVEGSTETDRGPSAFTAWFAGDTLRMLDERRSGGASSATARYYFDGERLLFVEQSETNPGPTPSSPADQVELRIPFDGRGRASGPSKTVNGQAVTLGSGEVAVVQRRAAQLATAARDARAAGGTVAGGGRWFGYEGGLEDAIELAEVYERASRFWRNVEGTWQGPRYQGTFTAVYDDTRLRRLSITYEPLEGGEARESGSGAYTYDEQGRLFFYAGEERRRSGRGRNASTTRVQFQVAMNARGQVGAVRKTVGRRLQPLEPAEIETLLGREERARQAAAAAR